MELSHLRYFLHVATERSFVRGAKAVHVTPPAISKTIRGLESELGVALLERSTRHVRLTPAGEVVLERARRILEQAESLQRDAIAATHEIKGELRIAAMEVFSIELLPNALAKLVRQHPALTPLTYELVPADMASALDRGLLDVAFSIGGADSPTITRTILGTSPAVVVSGRRFKRTRPQLAAEHWVVPRFLNAPHGPAIDQFPDDKHPRNVRATIELLQTGIRLVSSSAYVGCFPEISIRRELANGTLKKIAGAPRIPPFELAVFTRRSVAPSPAVDALIREMKRQL